MRGRIYVGTSLHNAAKARELYRRLEDAGCEITYDWTVHGQVYNIAELERYGVNEERGVESADVFLMVFPARNGSHCELGLARGFNVKIVLIMDEEEQEKKTFYYLPEVNGRQAVSRFTDEDTAIQYILEYLDHKYERCNP